ncbi:MAG: HYR domain-containing protein, partial [Saprospiraceae bacterium]
ENNAYVTGHTLSDDFPTTLNAFDQDYNGNIDAFFIKLNASGTSIAYSTYLGDTGTDYGVDIAVDLDNNAYIVGRTRSPNFPVTPFAYDIGFNWNSTNPPFEIVTDSMMAGCVGGGLSIGDTIYINDVDFDAFVIKLNTLDSNLIYATFIGGSDADEGVSIALDSMNNAYVMGVTESVDFPISTYPYDSTYNLVLDAFVARLDSGGRYLDYSTFVGGGGYDLGRSIALDADADIYVTGLAGAELNFPTTEQAYDTSYNGGAYDVFVLKLGGIINSTFLAVDCRSDILVDIPENQNTVQAFWELPFATTNCDTNATITISQIIGPPSGTFFEQGTHLISYKIESGCGDIDTCSFNVNVRALGVVSLACPEDIEVTTAPGVDIYLISWDVPSATTTCGSSNVPLVTQVEGINPNLNFPVGTHQVSYAAIDDCGYMDSCTFTVTVNPGLLIGELEINCLEDITVVAPAGATTQKVSWLVSASTNCNVNSNVIITQIDGLSSNSDFPIGTNFVSFQIYDNCNNIDTCSFNIIVNSTPIVGDMSLPCLEDITVEAVAGQNTHPVSWDLPVGTTTCNVSSNIDLVQTFGLPPNSDFSIGTHEIVYLAQDDCNNSEACSFTIIVEGEIVSTFDPQNQWDVTLNLYPNPSSDFLHLEMQTRKSQEVLIEIYALEGRLITSFKKELQMGNNGHIVPLLELANGLYILKVKGNSIYKTKKFVKQE